MNNPDEFSTQLGLGRRQTGYAKVNKIFEEIKSNIVQKSHKECPEPKENSLGPSDFYPIKTNEE